MDYFIQQGYPDAAQKFAQEANVDFKADDALMDERVSIREAIYQGDIERAIDEINSIDVQVGFLSSWEDVTNYMMILVFHAPLIAFGF